MKDRMIHNEKTTAYLGLGSNLGDRAGYITRALELLEAIGKTQVIRVSGFFETKPVGFPDQGDFINAVTAINTGLTPPQLLGAIQKIESALGRERQIRFGPRTIDLDILLFGEERLCSLDLEIPHPRMGERAFVLLPLQEIAPDNVIPGASLASLIRGCDLSGIRRI